MFTKKPGQNDKKQLMEEYLKTIEDREADRQKVRE